SRRWPRAHDRRTAVKLAALFLVTLGLAIVAAGSCSVNHLSDDFVCSAQRLCSSDRTCVDGLCVLTATDAGSRDGPGTVVDAATPCPAQCTSCVTSRKSCTIDCSLSNSCSQPVTCPTGWSCSVLCNTQGSCERGINCTASTSCSITCSTNLSCQN